MHSETKQPRFQRYLQSKFLYLLASLLLLIALSSFSVDHKRPNIIGELLFTAILLSGIWAVSRKKYQTTIAIILALPMLVTLWLTYLVDDKILTLATDFFSISFLLYTMILILSFIFKERKVTIDVIFAAIVVYLLIGVMWGFLFSVFEALNPGSFSASNTSPGSYAQGFLYFSFVTLTTLGYGDVTPLGAAAKSFAILEAVIGQMYIAVLIARLVGMYLVQMTYKKEECPLWKSHEWPRP